MAANFETGFSASGVTPWHGLGEVIKNAPTSEEAIRIAGLDWEVIPQPVYDSFGREIKGYKVNVRSSDNKILGMVTNKYKVVQNAEAFAFTDALLGEGVKYETAGSLASGKRVWMLARMENTTLCEENIDPYLVFTNSHDGTGAVRVAITPVRVVCQNTLNLALQKASRHWSCAHKGKIDEKLEEARYTLASAERYMEVLAEEFGELKLKKVTESQVRNMTERLLQIEFDALYKKAVHDPRIINLGEYMRRHDYEGKLDRKRQEILGIYFEKPDLRETEHTAFRFVNAVSDYATHTADHRETKHYQENLFMKTIDGNSMIDTAHKIALVA